MSQFRADDIRKLANLAHIDILDDEIELFRRDLEKIITYVDRLSEVDFTGLEPMQNPYDNQDVWREDVVKPSLPVEIALQNAPKRAGPFFVFPRIVPKKKGESFGDDEE